MTFGTLSAYTLISIGRACETTGKYSFRGIWNTAFNPQTAWIIDISISLLCFGCCIFYAAFIGDLSYSLAQAFQLPALFQKRWVDLVLLNLFPLLPLCLMKNLSALQYSSFVGVAGILYTVFFVVLRQYDGSYLKGGKFHLLIDALYRPAPIEGDVNKLLFKVGPGAVTLMNMACVAFTTHYNAINYYTELKNASLGRYKAAIAGGFIGSGIVFALMMTFGYSTFGAAAQPLLLNNYHKTQDTLSSLSRVATVFSIICGYPLMFAGLKTGFFSYYRSTVLHSRFSNVVKDALTSPASITLLSIALLASICGVAIVCTEEDVGIVIGVIGAILGTAVVYVIPAAINLRLLPKMQGKGKGEVYLNKGVVGFGLIFSVVGTISALKEHYPELFGAAAHHKLA